MLKYSITESMRSVNTFPQVFVQGELFLYINVLSESLEQTQKQFNNFNVEIDHVSIPLLNGEIITLSVYSHDLTWEEYYEETGTVHGIFKLNVELPLKIEFENALVAANYRIHDLYMNLHNLTLSTWETSVEAGVSDFSIEWNSVRY